MAPPRTFSPLLCVLLFSDFRVLNFILSWHPEARRQVTPNLLFIGATHFLIPRLRFSNLVKLQKERGRLTFLNLMPRDTRSLRRHSAGKILLLLGSRGHNVITISKTVTKQKLCPCSRDFQRVAILGCMRIA